MTKFKLALCSIALLAAAVVARAVVIVYDQDLVDETALTHSANYDLDLQAVGIGSLSAQATYSSATIAAVTFTDGQTGTGSFTIADNTLLSTASASGSIEVLSNTGLKGVTITMPGFQFKEGRDWATRDVSSNTAESLRLAIARTGLLTSRTAGTSVIYTTAPAAGARYNSWTMSSSNEAKVLPSGATLSGGRDPVAVSVRNIILREGKEWTHGASAGDSATALAAAINANPILSLRITASVNSSDVNLVSKTNAQSNGQSINLPLSTSKWAAISTVTMSGALPSKIGMDGLITIADHGLSDGLAVLLSTTSNTGFGTLRGETTYYAVAIDEDTVGLATTKDLALAGTYLTFTSSNTQSSQHTFTLTPLAITGTPSFKWQVSNDGSSWTDVAVSSVTMLSYSNPPDSTLWSFGALGTKWLRLKVTGPTTGGILLNVHLLGNSN